MQPHTHDGSTDLTPHALPKRMDANVGGLERLACTALGLSLIGLGLTRRGPARFAATAGGSALLWHGVKPHSFAYGALGIGSDDTTLTSHPLGRTVHSRSSVTIDRPAEELMRKWRDMPNFASLFPHIESVRQTGPGRTKWKAHLPNDRNIEWESEFSTDEANRRITWRTADDSPIEHAGSIEFRPAPAGRGTRIVLEQRYKLPGGAIGILLAKLQGSDPDLVANKALKRFKQVVETGEIATAAGPAGRGDGWITDDRSHTSPHPRRPALDPVDEASEDSFPASDPPSSTTAAATASTRQLPSP